VFDLGIHLDPYVLRSLDKPALVELVLRLGHRIQTLEGISHLLVRFCYSQLFEIDPLFSRPILAPGKFDGPFISVPYLLIQMFQITAYMS
jgi:hypothetical protein